MTDITEKCNFALYEFLEDMNKEYENKKWFEKLFYKFSLDVLQKAIFKYAYYKGYNDGTKDYGEELSKRLKEEWQ